MISLTGLADPAIGRARGAGCPRHAGCRRTTYWRRLRVVPSRYLCWSTKAASLSALWGYSPIRDSAL